MKSIKSFNDIDKDDVALTGGKGASLGEMTQAGIAVPPGFVILSLAFDEFLEETDLNVEIDSILHSVDSKKMHTVEGASEQIQTLISETVFPDEIAKEVKSFFNELGAEYVAVRSSATAEDSATASWAGQLESYLNTTEEELLENIKKCWASLFTPRAIFYRFEKKLHKQKISVAVVVQKMIVSEEAGIAFSVHPVTQDRNQIIIEAGFGLGEAIVSGSITPDSYVVEKRPRRIIDKNVITQERGLFRKNTGGNEWRDISEAKGAKQVLPDSEILELTDLILEIESHYGFPVDIEWAQEKNKFYIVQSRPITTLSKSCNKGEKVVLAKEHSREYSLFQVRAYCDTLSRAEKLIGYKPVNELFFYEGKDLVAIYHDPEEMKQLFAHIGKKAQEKKFVQKTIDSFSNSFKQIKPYFAGDLNTGSKKDLKKLYNLYLDFSTDLAFVWVIPNLEYVPKKLRDLAMQAREQTQEYSSERDKLFDVNLQKVYPQLGSSSHFILPEDVFGNLDEAELKKKANVVSKGYIYFHDQLVYGERYKDFLEKNNIKLVEPKTETNTSVLRGVAASGGVVSGTVKIMLTFKDMNKVNEGDILVAPMTRPDFLPAMKKAAAFVTDEGGITCHAAIVSREMKKPCIIGAKIATKILKDGDLVEVDAENGVVTVIKKPQ